jgi:hypothetical protein
LWILLIYFGGIYFAAYCSDVELRRRYFLCYFGIWTICGVALAIAFASVGPCFVNPMLGLHTFDAQMAYLRSANEHFPIMVLKVQDSLLEWQHSGQHGLGRGITAMPSMHIAQATLFWLGIRRVSPKAGYAFGAFLVVIYLGSIHLAYHYAVDGMIAAAVTVLLWLASRKLATSRMAADG